MTEKDEKIVQWLNQILDETDDCFLVSSKIGADASYQFFIDSDTGFTLEKSVAINRALRNKIEEAEIYPEGMFSLEISSPGISEPLKNIRQYKKNTGRLVAIETKEKESVTGRIVGVENDEIILEVNGKNAKGVASPKMPKTKRNINLNTIQKAIIQIEFK